MKYNFSMSMTRSQYIRKGYHKHSRPTKYKRVKAKLLHMYLKGKNPVTSTMVSKAAPCAKGTVLKVFKATPKKPNSAQRTNIIIQLRKNGKKVVAHVPGEGDHQLQEHSEVIIRHRNRKDLPGVRYEVIRHSQSDCKPPVRSTSRSRYGVKKPQA